MKRTFNQLFTLPVLALAFLMASGCKKDEGNTNEVKPPATPTEVVVPDAKLATQIKARLKLGTNDKIDTENILKLDTLNIDGEADLGGAKSEIASLVGLEKATNLVYLHFGYTKVTDLTPIKDLKKVKYLRMNNTTVSNLSPVSGYSTLTYFNANSAVQIKDISALGNNAGLKELILRDVVFGNAGMATIAKFTKLYRLNIRGTGITNIAVLGELMSKGALLKTTEGAAAAGGDASIDLRGNAITDYSPIAPYSATSVTVSK